MNDEWRYEQRWEMQEITPNLFVGPYTVAMNLNSLRAKGITHLLVLRSQNEPFIKEFHKNEFVYQTLIIENSQYENILKHFQIATEFIRFALNSGGKVLVHCVGGISRAPTIIIAYLMDEYHVNYESAFNMVQIKRFCMNPLDSFVGQLRGYGNILEAARSGAMQGVGHQKREAEQENTETATKRGRE